jgi:5-methylcytosine-specific restriction endonuclease McrA
MLTPLLIVRFPKVSEEFLVEHHMNYGLESSSGIRYDVQQQTYVQERDGMSYKLDKETQQWLPSQSYTDEVNHIKYTFSKKHSTWIPDVSTYSATDQEGKQQTYVWLKDQLQWALLSTVDNYTDHLTGIKYRWNNQTNSWDNEGVEPLESESSTEQKPAAAAASVPSQAQNAKKKAAEGECSISSDIVSSQPLTGISSFQSNG